MQCDKFWACGIEFRINLVAKYKEGHFGPIRLTKANAYAIQGTSSGKRAQALTVRGDFIGKPEANCNATAEGTLGLGNRCDLREFGRL